MSEVYDNYIRATYKLAKKGGPEWFEFVEAFKTLTMSELERALKSPLSEAQVLLGSGRRMVELRNDFIGIDQHAEKLRIR